MSLIKINPVVVAGKASATVRAERNRLLAESDWTQLLDIPEATRASWAVYRQALRDLPQQPGFPHDVAWPAKP